MVIPFTEIKDNLLVDIFTKLGVEFCFGYGLTETANLTSANANALEKPTSIGKWLMSGASSTAAGSLAGAGVFCFLQPATTSNAASSRTGRKRIRVFMIRWN